jgi:hypothetical protein
VKYFVLTNLSNHGGRGVRATSGAKAAITEILFVFISFTLTLLILGKVGRWACRKSSAVMLEIKVTVRSKPKLLIRYYDDLFNVPQVDSTLLITIKSNLNGSTR